MISNFYRNIFKFNAHVSIGFDLGLLLITTLSIIYAFPVKEGMMLSVLILIVNLLPLAISYTVANRSDQILDEISVRDRDLTADLEKYVQMARGITYWTAIGIALKFVYFLLVILAIYLYVVLKFDMYPVFVVAFAGYLLSVLGGALVYTSNHMEIPLSKL